MSRGAKPAAWIDTISSELAIPRVSCDTSTWWSDRCRHRALNRSESLPLRHRGRTGLTQRELTELADVSLRTLQDWEAGVTLPTAS